MAKKETEIKEEDLIVFEVETHYKSGVNRTCHIAAISEEEMWKIYDKRYNAKLIEWSQISDATPY